MVSIILPAYNAAASIAQAIDSVLRKTHPEWELLIVNDGSKDHTAEVIASFQDERIRYFYQDNQGVSAARNRALREMKGNYFTFLDADYLLPTDSLQKQVDYMNCHPDVNLLGGRVVVKDAVLQRTIQEFQPSFYGNPFEAYIRLQPTCFFSVTGFLRNNKQQLYAFKEQMTHGEDLLFYTLLAVNPQFLFASVEFETYIYRQSSQSAMSNLSGLERGYQLFYREVAALKRTRTSDLIVLKFKILRITVLSYIKNKEYLNALKAIKNMFL
jgi:glycosyltransferase involved in cell wall biosynthesis